MRRSDWWPDFGGKTVVIAASGPSQNKADLDFVRGKAPVIAINRTWELCPWADVLYSAGTDFWQTYKPEFKGLKVSGDQPWPGCEVICARDWVHEDKMRNSGSQAIVLAERWGAGKILLTGFDMEGRHWHECHQNGNPYTRFGTFIAGLEEMRPGVPVINCSRRTAIGCFAQMPLDAALK